MPMVLDEKITRIKPHGTTSLIRPNYRSEPLVTKAEAAQEAGVTVRTINRWIKAGCFPVARRVGAARIPFDLFLKFLRTGEKQIGPVRMK